MSGWKLLDERGHAQRIVLVLQGDRACWFREAEDSDALEVFSESIDTEGMELHSCCPWIQLSESGLPTDIHLVLDSHLDEVDRVKVPDMSEGRLRPLQWRRMKRRLRADFPSASLHALPAYAAPDVMSIVHNLLPEHWQSWLALLQKELVSVSHVASSIELLAHLAVEQSELRGKPVLFNMPAGGYARHLLVDDGVPLFMRLVRSEHEPAGSAEAHSIEQTLEHVRAQIVGAEVEPVVLYPDQVDYDACQGAHLLADLCLGNPVGFSCFISGMAGSYPPGAERAVCTGRAVPDRVGKRSMPARLLAQWRHGRAGRRWLLTANHRFSRDLLQASIASNAQQLRIRQLQKATLLCVWLAAAAVVAASVHGVTSARQRSRLSTEQQLVVEQVEALSAVSSELHRNPAFLVRSMERIDTHQQAAPSGAQSVLQTVAAALEDFPELVLDDVSWSAYYEEPLDAVFTTAGQAPARERLWLEGSAKPPLQIELGGMVTDARGLREQQRILEGFVRDLEFLPGVGEVRVLESPVNAARSSDRISRHESVYRVSLRLGE